MGKLMLRSLRGKILIGFSLLAGTVLLSFLIMLVETTLIEEKIEAQKETHVLLNAIYELRRQEKNYLLYQQRSDLEHIETSLGELSAILDRSLFPEILDTEVRTMREVLVAYAKIVSQLTLRSPGREGPDLRAELRKKGNDAIELAKAMTKKLDGYIVAKFARLKIWLFVSKIFLATLAVVTAFKISSLVIRSLKDFKGKMDGIMEGRFSKLPQTATDEEIASLEQACNRMLEEISLRQAYLVQSEKLASLGTMMAGIAHELNNPLSNISASCQILLEEMVSSATGVDAPRGSVSHQAGGREEGAQRQPGSVRSMPDRDLVWEMLLQIEDETERAKVTIQSLLDYSRTRPSEKTLFALRPLVHDTVTLLQGSLEKGIEVWVSIPDDVRVFGDRHRIQQVFVNLMKNALDAMDTVGTLSIAVVGDGTPAEIERERVSTLRSSLTHTNQPCVDIAVSDTGKGIPRDQLSMIFDPFFTTKDVGHGTGLGLFVAREIVEDHHGGIAVDSEEGAGTLFILRLPGSEGG